MYRWFNKNPKRAATTLGKNIALRCQKLRDEGNTLLANGDLSGAEQCYRVAMGFDPEDATIRLSLGSVLVQQKRPDEAFSELNSVLVKNPNNAEIHYLLGGLFEQREDCTRAAFHFQRAFELNPNHEMACCNACRVLFQLGHITSAGHLIAAGLALNPACADLHFYEGNLHFANDALDWALESYRESLVLGADHSALHGFIGGILLKQNDIGQAFVHLQRAINLDHNNSEAHHDLGVIHIRLGNVEDAIRHQEITIAQDPTQLQAYSCLLFTLGSSIECTPQNYLKVASDYAWQVRKMVRPLTTPPSNGSFSTDERRSLRIGFVSGDFRKHVNLKFLMHVLVGLVADAVEIVAFSNNPYDDDATIELSRLITQWHNIRELSDHDAATLIHACHLDVLIDLAGHTAHNRLPVFAWRPAPIQVSWLGFFASTGLVEMDYLIADRVSVPENLHSHFKERIWYLPETRLCMAPPQISDELEIQKPPAETAGYITFGCFQALSKINDSVLTVWAQVMSRVPNSRLRLQVRNLELPGVRDRLLDRILQAGIPKDRVILHGGVPVHVYLAAHNEVDIILDTFPYPGGTTTAEALWMGVPTITLKGKTLLSRQGASMLQNAGLSEWIADNEVDYVKRAVTFASNINSLAHLRAHLRQQVLESPLFDSRRFTIHFLAALRAMHQKRNLSQNTE